MRTGCAPQQLQAKLAQPLYEASRRADKAYALSSILELDRRSRELNFEITDVCADLAGTLRRALEACGVVTRERGRRAVA